MKTTRRLPILVLLCVTLTACTSVHSKIEINAPAETVKAVLYDFDRYPSWNPFIVKIDGKVQTGNTVKVTVKPVGKAQISGDTRVLLVSDTHLIWRGSLKIPGLFRGKHEFIIESLGPNRTLFQQNEAMSGLVIPFLNTQPTELGFKAMNESLKAQAEAQAPSH